MKSVRDIFFSPGAKVTFKNVDGKVCPVDASTGEPVDLGEGVRLLFAEGVKVIWPGPKHLDVTVARSSRIVIGNEEQTVLVFSEGPTLQFKDLEPEQNCSIIGLGCRSTRLYDMLDRAKRSKAPPNPANVV